MISSINHTTESDCCPAGLDSMASYKKKFESFGCFNPECKSGFDIEVHHIIPKSKGGKNEYYNYILLCFECHRKSKNHRSYHERRTALWTWKFYFESKHGDKSNLLVLPSGDPKAENRKREDSSEILQQEMQIELSQSTEKKEKPRSVRKGIKRSAPKASPLKRIICKTCNRDALVYARGDGYCSRECRATDKRIHHETINMPQLKDLDNSFRWLSENLTPQKKVVFVGELQGILRKYGFASRLF